MSIFINVDSCLSKSNNTDLNDYLLEFYNVILDDIILEGTDGSNVLQNIKKMMIAFFNKILEFLQNLVKFLTSFFLNGKRFADKYGKTILNKDDKGFTFRGKLLILSTGIRRFIEFNKVTKEYIETIGYKIRTSDTQQDQDISNNEYIESLFKKFPDVNTKHELLRYISSGFEQHGSFEGAVYIMTGFTMQHRNEVIDSVSKFTDLLKSVTDIRKDTIEMKNKIIQEFDKVESETKNPIESSNMKKFSSLVKSIFSIRLDGLNVCVKMYKETYHENMRLLREFLLFTPLKTTKS